MSVQPALEAAPSPVPGGGDPPHPRLARVLEDLRASQQAGDGRVYLLAQLAADLSVQPGRVERVAALLEVSRVSPWLICLVVRALAQRVARLFPDELKAVVSLCLDALEAVPEDDRLDLLEDMARDGYHPFLTLGFGLSLERGPREDVSFRFAQGMRLLPPSARAHLELDRLVALCLDRMGPDPLASWLDNLLQVVALRDLTDETLQERLVSAYAAALELADVQARHRERLQYLLRFTSHPETAARLEVRLDLAQLATIPRDIGEPELLLGRLSHCPMALKVLPEKEAQAFIGFILRRLVRHLTEDDHLRLGQTLLCPERPGPFFTAYLIHLKHVTLRASDATRLELWGAFFGAWLGPKAGPLAETMRPFVASVVQGLERDLFRELSRRQKRRFGAGLEGLVAEKESAWRWAWPWTSRLPV